MCKQILKYFKSAITAPLVQENQRLQTHYESELAAKDVTIAELENSVAYYKGIQKSYATREQWLSNRERNVEDKERDLERREQLVARSVDSIVAERERDLDRREYELDLRERNIEETITREVAEGIKGKQKGINDNWVIIKREKRVLEENKQKMLKRAKLISEHLAVPLECILTSGEKALVRELSKELKKEHYALIDLVMSCPASQAKALLATVRLFLQNKPIL